VLLKLDELVVVTYIITIICLGQRTFRNYVVGR